MRWYECGTIALLRQRTAHVDREQLRNPHRPAGRRPHAFRSTACRRSRPPGFPRSRACRISLKILLENLLRQEDGRFVKPADIEALARWDVKSTAQKEISFAPARVLLQDFTGVPAVVDLAAMRDGIARLGGDPNQVNPLQPVELVIDHSVQVDYFGQAERVSAERRARVLAQQGALRVPALGAERVPQLPRRAARHRHRAPGQPRVPRARGRVRRERRTGALAYPDTLVGTDSHTTMVNGLGVVGWGVGGIEAEAAMLGQPISMLIPAGARLPADGRDARGRDRHRSGADHHRAAAQARRRRQVRRVLRARPRASDDCRPRDARQHVSRSTARRSRSSRSTR